MNICLFALLIVIQRDGDTSGLFNVLVGTALFIWIAGFFWYFFLCGALAHLAYQKGHSGLLWFAFAVVWTPLIGALFLAAAPQRSSAWSALPDPIQPMPERRASFIDG